MEEAPEFSPQVLQTLLQPLESGELVIHRSGGTTVECKESDLRRLPVLTVPLTDWELPCASALPVDAAGAFVVVFDDYN